MQLELPKLNVANYSVVSNSVGLGSHVAVDGIGDQILNLLIKPMPRFDPSDVHLF
jgi:hypothetical protein